METNDGDLYGVPIFMFTENDLFSLKSGWDQWLKADEDAKFQAELSLRLPAPAFTRQRNEVAARPNEISQPSGWRDRESPTPEVACQRPMPPGDFLRTAVL